MTAIANTQSLHDTVTARIIAELEQGRFPWVQPWASSSGGTPLGLPQNASTGRTYSGINILLLWAAAIEQGRPSQCWLTYLQAVALGGNVRKGEKGTTVVYADTFVPKAEQAKASASGEDARRVGFLKRFTVFHVEQCEGLPADPDAPQLPGRTEVLSHVDAAIAATGADIRIGGDMAFYSPSHDFIQVPPQQAYFEPIDWYRTVLHELGHLSGHSSRLNRDFSGPARNSSLNCAQLSSAPSSVSSRLFAMRTTSAPGSIFSRAITGPSSRQPRWRQKQRISSWGVRQVALPIHHPEARLNLRLRARERVCR
jgi:antirestriction protein ArdC